MRLFRYFLTCALVIGLTAAPNPARAVEASNAVCEPPAPANMAAIKGNGVWNPPVTALSTTHAWSMNFTAECRVGTGHDVGDYSISFVNGTSDENCEAGRGQANISGTGPGGTALSGNISFVKGGVHYYFVGNMRAFGHDHVVNFWIDVIPQVNQGGNLCYYDVAGVFGHGDITSVTDQ